MNDDFRLVREAFAESFAGRTLRVVGRSVLSAWRTSAAARATRSITASLATMPPTTRAGTVAAAIAIASALQPTLMMLMPRTVVPALPSSAFVAVAIFAGVIAWRPAAFVAAWQDSRLARALRR